MSAELFRLDRTDRERLEITGPDRAKFLHNLTTNDIKRLAAGQGVEAFVTSPQGKTLGYVSILATDDRLIVRTDPGGLAGVLPHFKKYGVFDDIALDDVRDQTFEVHLAGARAEDVLTSLGCVMPEAGELRHGPAELASKPVRVIRESPFGVPGFTLIGPRAGAEAVEHALAEHVAELQADEAEVLRIEAGTPVFGRDVTPDHLPQEVDRDDRAINFVKGCYLGQETVARIDAIGHVNRQLRGLVVVGDEAPPPSATIQVADKPVGVVTSSAFSARRGSPVALGYVRVSHRDAGTAVSLHDGERTWEARVVDLPMPSN